jgi:hypothetical protein
MVKFRSFIFRSREHFRARNPPYPLKASLPFTLGDDIRLTETSGDGANSENHGLNSYNPNSH